MLILAGFAHRIEIWPLVSRILVPVVIASSRTRLDFCCLRESLVHAQRPDRFECFPVAHANSRFSERRDTRRERSPAVEQFDRRPASAAPPSQAEREDNDKDAQGPRCTQSPCMREARYPSVPSTTIIPTENMPPSTHGCMSAARAARTEAESWLAV